MKALFQTKRTALAVTLLLILTAFSGGYANANNYGRNIQPAIKAVTAHPVGAQDFTLVNETGVEIHNLYISPTHVNDWEEDILGRDTLASGDTVDIHFKRSEQAAKWDIRVQDSQGNALIWEGLNLLEISKVILYYNDGHATATVE